MTWWIVVSALQWPNAQITCDKHQWGAQERHSSEKTYRNVCTMFKLWPRRFLTYNKSVSEDNCCVKADKQLLGMLRVNWRGNWNNICPLIRCEVFLASDIRMFFSIFIVLFGGVALHVTNCIISAEKILMPWHPLSYYPASELSLKWGQTRLFPQLKQKVSKSSEACKSSLCAQPSNDAIPKEYWYRRFVSRGTGRTATDVCSSVFQTALELPPLPHHKCEFLGLCLSLTVLLAPGFLPSVSTHVRPVPSRHRGSTVSLIGNSQCTTVCICLSSP